MANLLKANSVAIVIVGTLIGGQSLGVQDSRQAVPRNLYFPPRQGLWEHIEPSAAGWDSKKLEAALDFAGQRRSSGVVVLYRGRILIERYWDLEPKPKLPNGQSNRYYYTVHGKTSQGHVIEDVASVQKSVVSMLAGIAQHKGLLKVSDPVQKYLGEGWSKAARDAEAKITLRHLLTMTSGLTDALEYEAPAGTRWRYNTTAYSRVLRIISVAAQMEPDELTRLWLTSPIGMDDSHWIVRPRMSDSEAANTVGFATTARDLARFGLLILAQGTWANHVVIDEKEYLRAALQSSQDLNPSYGYLWWLNGKPSVLRGSGERRLPGPLIPTAPADLVAAEGAMGRKLYVVPSKELVVTRLGATPEGANQASFEVEFWKRLMAAAATH